MKLIHSDVKKGVMKVKPESLEDLFVLSSVIDRGDTVKARTIRKIKIGGEGDRKASVIKKPVTLAVSVEKAEFAKDSNVLRISGKIAEEHEDIPKGSFHTLSVEENEVITIFKERWLGFQLDKIYESVRDKYAGVLLVVLDRDEAFFALVEKYGYKILSEITGDVEKKRYVTKTAGNFFEKIAKSIEEYSSRYPEASIVLASPAFWKEELFKMLDGDLKKKTILATCSSADKTAVEEVLKRPELKTALKNAKVKDEISVVERLLTEIAKNSLAVYGMKDCKHCSDIGAIDVLIVSDGFILSSRQENFYQSVEGIMRNVEDMNGKVVIVSSDNQPGKSVDALGGIAAILRYKVGGY